MTQHQEWYPLMDITSHKGRVELAFPKVPQEIGTEKLHNLTREWATNELVSQGIVCDVRILEGNTVEIWCCTYETLPDGNFGDRLKIWDDQNFKPHLAHSFGDAVNKALALQHS